MSRLLAASLGVVLCVSTQVARAQDNELTPEEKGAGWTLLFDGKSLDGWMRSDGKPSNRGVDHEAINPHRCGAYMLVFDKEFSNFELKCDFKVSPLCNSGIFVRTYPLTPRKNKDVGYNGIEVAIDDGIKEGYHATGAIYDLSPALVDATKPTGQWNHIEVKCDGPNITVDLKLVDHRLELPDRLRAHNVERRVVDGDAPVGGRASGETNLCVDCLGLHGTLLLAMQDAQSVSPALRRGH